MPLTWRKNAAVLAEALRGPRAARARHADFRAQPATVAAGIETVRRRWPGLAGSDEAPIFVLGAGWRSGSTLIQRMLMADDLIVWGEPYTHSALVDTLSSQLKAFNARWPRPEFFVSERDDRALSNAWVANLYPSPQRLLDAHIAYFDALYAQPAAALGKPRWGVKDVLLTTEHAFYLRWLYPRARFIFLVRDPYRAWASYRRWRSWYRHWPDRPVHTPLAFGRLWRELAQDFVANHQRVDGVLVRYEDLGNQTTHDALAGYLERAITPLAALARLDGATDAPPRGRRYVPKPETWLLARQVEPLAAELGYRRGR